jgi:hypothetical protein
VSNDHLQRSGRVLILNGRRFFSPNSRRDVCLPPPNPPVSGFDNTFWPDKPRLNDYLVPRWLTQEFGFLAYLPRRPMFFGTLLEPLRTIPPVEMDDKKKYRLPLATMKAWADLEADLEFVVNFFNFTGTGYVVYYFPPPSSRGYTRPHATKQIAESMARMSRDWFSILMGAVSYVLFAYRFPAWFDKLKEKGISQAWIASLEASTIMDRDFERVGCFLNFHDPTRSHPEKRLLRQLKVPMWYPWEQQEIDLVAERRRKNTIVGSFWIPTQEELDNATVINRYDSIPRAVSHRPYNPPAFRRIPSPVPASSSTSRPSNPLPSRTTPSTLPPPSNPPRAGTPPPAKSGQKPGQTWQAFFEERRKKQAAKKETDRERVAREARERQPGRNRSHYFEWRRNSVDEWIRHPVNRQEGQRLLDDAEPGETIYDAATDVWDICEDFITLKPKPTVENDFEGFDYDDVNDFEHVMMTGTTKKGSSSVGHVAPGPSAPITRPSPSLPISVHVAGPSVVAAPIPVPLAVFPPDRHLIRPYVPLDAVTMVPAPSCVPPPPPPPPFEESIYRPSLLDFVRVRYGFVPPDAPSDPPIPSCSESELKALDSVLGFGISVLRSLPDFVVSALLVFLDAIIGRGTEGGAGLTDQRRPGSTLSLRGVAKTPPTSSWRHKKNLKEKQIRRGHRPDYAGSSSRSREPGEIDTDNSVAMSVDVPRDIDIRPADIDTDNSVAMSVDVPMDIDIRPKLLIANSDVHPANPSHLYFFARLLGARKLTFVRSRNPADDVPCYVLPFPSDAFWSLGFTSAADLLYVCRLRLDNAVDIASKLLQIGISFKTLVHLPSDWKPRERGTDIDALSLPTPMEIPYRCKNYSFTATDYAVYERQRQMLFAQRHLRAACLVGGIVWRLGRDLLREEEVLSGPTDTAVVFGEGVFYRDAQGDLWCDDTLTEHEMDLVCGLHNAATGMYHFTSFHRTHLIYTWQLSGNNEQMAKRSYWPLHSTWTQGSAGLCPRWWAPNLDGWFDKRRDNLRAGSRQPLTASQWKAEVKGTKRATRLRHGTEVLANLVLKDAGL